MLIFDYLFTLSLRAFPALKAGAVVAGIFIFALVWGLTPSLADLSLVSNVPNPINCTFSFFANSFETTFTKEFIVASVSFLERPVSLAIAFINSALFIADASLHY